MKRSNSINNQKGAVAMITVIFVAILLTIITTSFVRLSIHEQREATDDDLTTRAFYAAESGVQDAITAIKNRKVTPLSHAQDCTPETGDGELSANLDTAYTCQTIDLTPPNYEASLAENRSVFFILDSGADNISSFTVSWHQYGDDADGTNAVVRSDTDLPSRAEWNDSGTPPSPFPAMMRLQVLEVPDTNITRSNIENGSSVAFLNPVNGSGQSTLAVLDGSIQDAECNMSGLNTGDYACKMTITGLSDGSNTYYLRLRAVYRPTHVKVVARTSAGVVTSLVGAQAVIDVTGRAADVYRRVEERVNIAPDDLWPDFAIMSAEPICKDFVITDEDSDFVNINNPDPNAPRSCKF